MRSQSARALQHAASRTNGYLTARSSVIALAKVMFMGISQAGSTMAAPLSYIIATKHHTGDGDEEDVSLWLYLTIAMVLVLLGGAFAGLTIALMGQDGIYLQVIATSGEGKEQKHAQKVFRLLKRGKHWVLVTLLLSNVIVNETLPIVLDRSLGGGWPAVLGSTILIVIFGEVIPQSVCVRYGLQIGAFMAPPVLLLMFLLAPVAWPTAKLLDWALGEDHGTVYKKSGLKTLVDLHKTLGTSPDERLNQDEVTIISAVLDLKEKSVGSIMTPMDDVFTMSADTILDEPMMDTILSAGYSRIPIYEPGNATNFVGMLLVKILITYDPEDAMKVSDFSLATLPETRPETSCLDIVNFFQEGKSHMVLVSDNPGENYGAAGVVTLEDVIEELIGEEIIDESDVFVDVHKAIRRLAPAPRARMQRTQPGQIVDDPDGPKMTEDDLIDMNGDASDKEAKTPKPSAIPRRINSVDARSRSPMALATSPKTSFMRRSSSGHDHRLNVRGNLNDMREHLKHLGPSNLASRPKTTRYNTVKIKQQGMSTQNVPNRTSSLIEEPYSEHAGGEGEGLLSNAGREASDGIIALHQGYGTTSNLSSSPRSSRKHTIVFPANGDGQADEALRPSSRRINTKESNTSDDTLGSLESLSSSPKVKKHGTARSGSITENIIDSNGVRKVVLETNSGSSSDLDLGGASTNAQEDDGEVEATQVKKKKNRRKIKKRAGPTGGASGR